MSDQPKMKLFTTLIRAAICGVLMAWIFQAIFWSEGQRAWEKSGNQPEWNELTRKQRLEISWEHGPRNLWRNLKEIRPDAFALSILVMGATIFLSVIRWRQILRVHGLNLSLGRAAEISIVAHFFNTFLPSTGGDLIKAYYAARETYHKKIEAVSTVFVDRIIGLFALLLFACAMMPMNIKLLKSDATFRNTSLFVLAMSAAGFVATFLAFRGGMSMGFSSKAREWIRKLPKGDMLEKLRDAFLVFGKHKTALFQTVLLSLFIHFVAILHVQTVAWGMDSKVTFLQLVTVVPIISCFIALPISPSGLGVREGLIVYMFHSSLIGDTPSKALSISLLLYAGLVFWSLVGGVVYTMFKSRHHLDDIAHETAEGNGNSESNG